VNRSARAVAALASLALALPLAGTVGTADADPAPPARATAAPFRLWAPTTVETYGYRGRVWTDLGLRIVATGAPLELWSQRPSYAEPIRTVWRSPAGDVPLPAGSMRDFSGLQGFLRLTITPARGEAVTVQRKACLSGWSERVDPAAPATSPYPSGCWNNPFSLGSVQGTQAGWATLLLGTDKPLRLEPGRYRVTAEVAPRYAAAFGLAPAQASRTVRLVVKEEEIPEEEPAPEGTPPDAERAASPGPTGLAGRVDGPVPDLRALPAWGISLSRNSKYLRFSATVWNAGTSPLVVDGFRERGKDEMTAYQYFFDAAGNQTGYQPVGHLHWDAKPSHQHWHFEDFARYTLLRRDKTQAAVSKKEAFCLANTDAVDLTIPDAAWKPENTDLATSCGDLTSLSIREVLAAGWGDTYTQFRAGQSFRVDDLPNGVYYIAVNANPGGNLAESSTTNNLALRRIKLGGTPGDRTVTVPAVGLISDEKYGGTG
jgi:lysyl oxidase